MSRCGRSIRTGLAAAALLFLSVAAWAAWSAPSIRTHPLSQAVDAGSQVTFWTSATGTSPLAYRWLFDNREIAGYSTNQLVLTNVQPAQSGPYAVIVSDATGSVTSRVARLEVVVPLPHSFAGIMPAANRQVTLTLQGQTSTVYTQHFDIYRLAWSSDLAQWHFLTHLIRTNAVREPLLFVDQQSVSHQRRFYQTPTNHFVTPSLPPTGPYGVGRTVRLVTDSTRTNRFNLPTNSSFPVTIWYPARAKAGELPARFEDLPLARDGGRWGNYTNLVPHLVTHAVEEAALVEGSARFPIVLYSHGGASIRTDGQDKAENLASHGYVVVSPEHNDTFGTLLPDGRFLRGKLILWGNRTSEVAAFNDRIQDLNFLMDELSRWNQSDPVFARRLDLGRVAALGISFGGGVAADFCRTDERCLAAISLDGYLQGAPAALRTNVFPRPFLGIYTPEGGGDRTIFNKAVKDAFYFLIRDTIHENINARYWYFSSIFSAIPDFPGAATRVQRDREAAMIFNRYLLSFLNKYLRQQDDRLLDGAPADIPRVVGFQKK